MCDTARTVLVLDWSTPDYASVKKNEITHKRFHQKIMVKSFSFCVKNQGSNLYDLLMNFSNVPHRIEK